MVQSLQHSPESDVPGRKLMLCVWWDSQDIIHLEFLKCKETLNVYLYV